MILSLSFLLRILKTSFAFRLTEKDLENETYIKLYRGIVALSQKKRRKKCPCGVGKALN